MIPPRAPAVAPGSSSSSNSAGDSVGAVAASISITSDDDLDAAVGEDSRSDVMAEAVREHLDRRAVAAAAAWHGSLTGVDAAVFAEFNAER